MRAPIPLLIAALVAAGCESTEPVYDHSDEHPTGHDHHAEEHGHGDGPVVAMTLWSEQFEVFAESHGSAVGEPVSLLIHITELEGFRALEEGTLTLVLDGPAKLSGSTSKAFRPGIFQLSVTPKVAGHYRGELRIDGPHSGVVKGLTLEVGGGAAHDDHEHGHADGAEDHHDQPPGGDTTHDGLIEFLKEQQWGVPFATAFARRGVIVPAIQVAGRVGAPPSGIAEVSAPVTGRLVAPKGGFPAPGTEVTKGQILANLIPAPTSPEALVDADVRLSAARARAEAAAEAADRARRLVGLSALPDRDLRAAERERVVARGELAAAVQIVARYAGEKTAESLRLRAPISGTVVDVHARVGAISTPGDTLFRIIDLNELWVIGQVPERLAGNLRPDGMPSFRTDRDGDWQALRLHGDQAPARLVSIGRTVSPESRTVEVIYALNPAPNLRFGGLVEVSLPAGDEVSGVVVPRRAVIDRDGRSVVYVQVDGEHFEERQVRTGARAAGQVAIESGLRGGERVVTTGAHLVRLAERSKDKPSGGHIH